MKNTSDIDFRTRDARAAKAYLKKADIYALAAKAGPETHFLLFTREEFELRMKAREGRKALRLDRGTLRWNGLERTHLAKLGWTVGVHKFLRFRKRWNEFEVGSNGTMSSDQEQTITDELNRINFLGKQWRWVGEECWKDGTPDIVSTDGEIRIEVKGFGGMLSNN